MQARYTLKSTLFIISMFNLLWVPNFIKIRANFGVWTKFAQIYNFGLRSSVPSTIIIITMFNLESVPNSIKIGAYTILRPNLPKFLILIQDLQFSNIIFKINELDLLWVPNFIKLEIYFINGTKFFWNEGLMLVLTSNLCYLVEILIFLVITWWLLLVT